MWYSYISTVRGLDLFVFRRLLGPDHRVGTGSAVNRLANCIRGAFPPLLLRAVWITIALDCRMYLMQERQVCISRKDFANSYSKKQECCKREVVS